MPALRSPPRQGFRVVLAEDCWMKSLVPLMADVRRQMGGKPLYISFDIDGLDPAYAPGTGTPEIAGLTPSQVRRFHPGRLLRVTIPRTRGGSSGSGQGFARGTGRPFPHADHSCRVRSGQGPWQGLSFPLGVMIVCYWSFLPLIHLWLVPGDTLQHPLLETRDLAFWGCS